MEKRRLGNSELYVNPVGLGCMGFSHASGDPMEKGAAVKTIREAYEIGYDFFDTAEVYTGVYADGTISYNEELVGEALKGVRDQVVIATKMGVHHNEDLTLRMDSRPEIIQKSVEESLKRLGTDYIDLYYQHRIDPKKFEGRQDYRGGMPQYTKEGYAKAKGLLELLSRLAEEKHATMGQISLAWMLCKKPYIVPIPGSRKIERLKENFGAGSIALSAAEVADIDAKLDTMSFDVFGGHTAK